LGQLVLLMQAALTVRRGATALAVLLTILALAPALADELTPDAAYALVVRAPLSRDPLPKPEELTAARRVLETQAVSEPKSARWAFALAHVANAEAEQAKDDAAKNKRKEALDRFEQAAELQSGNADYQFWLASASFDCVDDVGMLSKMSLASDGRKAFEKAITLDPGHVGARVGLAEFLLNAPGMAGGSVEKAKAQGDALLALPGKRGEFQGRMVLAGIAAHEENWPEMSQQLTAAETAQGDGADPVAALRSHAWFLLNRKKDAQAAVPVVSRYVKAVPADDLTALFFDGEVKRQLSRCADALPRYDQVIAKFAAARGSRWGAAVCREQLGQKDAARRDYEEYARRFPDDDRTKEAKAAIKRLQ
jgi:tetratricopeptide (TPR) repeat protein